ncbi:hypothetical protein U1Q18_051952 [Sarracenia purpurea var. burkii]
MGMWVEYPILKLEFSRILPYNVKSDIPKGIEQLYYKLKSLLATTARKYHVDLNAGPLTDLKAKDVIDSLYRKFNLPVIVLVDEYDSVANSAMYQVKNEFFTKAVMKLYNDFFTDLKSAASSIKLVWVTGVNKLGIDALDNDPNNFVDFILL